MSTTENKKSSLKQLKVEIRNRLSSVAKAAVPAIRVLPNSFRLFGLPGKISTCKALDAAPIYSTTPIQRQEPKTLDAAIHWRFTRDLNEEERQLTPEVFVLELEKGISTSIGANLSQSGALIPEVSKQFDLRKNETHKIIKSPKIFPKIHYFDTAVATIAFEGQDNYFHWMLDALPQFHLLDKLNLSPKKLYIECESRFQKETLGFLGYREEQIISSKQFPYISAATLIVPSFPGKSGYPPAWACQFLRETFLPHREQGKLERPDQEYQRIYLSRRSAKRRRILNEAALVSFLKSYGFIEVQTDHMSVLDQVRLFNNAEIVVAPHGAGLTNLVFCQPQTKVVELFSPQYVNGCFWTLCEQVGLCYYYLIGEGSPPPEYYESRRVTDDIEVSLSKVKNILDLAEITRRC